MAPRPGEREGKVTFKGSLSFSHFSSLFFSPVSPSLRGKSVEFLHVFCGLLVPVWKLYENILKEIKKHEKKRTFH